jgi:hypothetical protein
MGAMKKPPSCHSDVNTTMMYIHALKRGLRASNLSKEVV